jgi:hypothetical protein
VAGGAKQPQPRYCGRPASAGEHLHLFLEIPEGDLGTARTSPSPAAVFPSRRIVHHRQNPGMISKSHVTDARGQNYSRATNQAVALKC